MSHLAKKSEGFFIRKALRRKDCEVFLMEKNFLPDNEKLQNNALGNNPSFSTTYQDKKARYTLLNKVQKILPKDFKRVKNCSKIPLNGSVKIFKSVEHGHTFFGGLNFCGSVWLCPVCSAKIQARRAIEISKVCFHAYSNDQKIIMLTLTHPHHKGQSLKNNMKMHNDALKLFRMGRSYDLFKKRIGYNGLIRGSEITHGKNGWHFHTHELLIVSNACNISSEVKFIKKRWLNCCKRAGFAIENENAFLKHSADIMDNCHASDYLAKFGRYWGIDREIAKGASKTHGKTPFELLESENPQDEALFIEYARETKGKKQLFFSKGLKARCGIEEKTDEEIADEQNDRAEVIAELDADQWKLVIEQNARAEILEIAYLQGFDGLFEWFSRFGKKLRPPNTFLSFSEHGFS